jgi:hypothetical protein
VIDHLVARRPDWDLHVFETVATWLLEVPAAYTAVLAHWLVEGRDMLGGEAAADSAKA